MMLALIHITAIPFHVPTLLTVTALFRCPTILAYLELARSFLISLGYA